MSRSSLAVIAVTRNSEGWVGEAVRAFHASASGMADELQMVVVDMGSSDGTESEIEAAVAALPDMEALFLSGHGEGIAARDIAFLAGMEHAVAAECLVLVDLEEDEPDTLPALVAAVREGADIAVAAPKIPQGSLAYHGCSLLFRGLVTLFGGTDPRRQAGRYRAMSRRAASHLLRHDASLIGGMPRLRGFRSVTVGRQGSPVGAGARRTLSDGIRSALALMTSSSTAPLRLATGICSVGALLSVLQSAWAVSVYVLKGDVAPGWTTLSLQVSVMFMLMSVAMGAIAEYVGGLSRAGRPPYHLMRQISSSAARSRGRLNVMDGGRP